MYMTRCCKYESAYRQIWPGFTLSFYISACFQWTVTKGELKAQPPFTACLHILSFSLSLALFADKQINQEQNRKKTSVAETKDNKIRPLFAPWVAFVTEEHTIIRPAGCASSVIFVLEEWIVKDTVGEIKKTLVA